VIINPAITIF